MRRQLRVFRRLLALNISLTFVYRGDFLILQLANLTMPLISLLVWRAVLAGGAQLPVNSAYLDTYFVLTSLVRTLASSWSAFFWSEAIRTGDLNRWLIRPASMVLDGLANNLGEKSVKIILLTPVVAVVIIALGGVAVPGGRWTWLLAAAALVCAAGLAFCFDIARAALAFWFEDVQGFNRALDLIRFVLSGAIVPLVLLPGALGGVLQWQPFRFMISFPIEVWLDQVPGGVGLGFAQLAGWLVVTAAGAYGLWRLGLRRYTGVGA